MGIAPMGIGSMESLSAEFMPMACESAGPSCVSRSAGSPSGQISITNGRPLAGMKPGGMSIRRATATSRMPAMNVRLIRLPELKRVSHGVFPTQNLISKSEGV